MAESKRTFQAAKMNKDIDDRLLQPGTYRDALNVSVEFSEDGNVGALENLKGNEILSGQNILGLSSSSNPNAEVIGSYAHPEESKIYYFVTGDKTDGIFEYDISDPDNPVVSTIIVDSSEAPLTPVQKTFTFADAVVTGAVSIDGTISVQAVLGEALAITDDFNETVSTATVRKINVKVIVPSGYSNSGKTVIGQITATQQPIAAPEVTTLEPTNITTSSVTLNGEYSTNSASLTEIGFYYIENTGGSTAVNVYTNKFVITKLQGNSALIGKNFLDDPFSDVPSSDITVLDKDGAVISSSNYTYIDTAGAMPSAINFATSYNVTLPVTVAQTSTLTALTDGRTKAEVYTSGTKVSITGNNITSPFNHSLSVSEDTEYAYLAFAKNASGTTYGDVKYFKSAVNTRTFPSGEFIWTTNIGVASSTPTGANRRNIGYGPFSKNNKTYIFAAYPNSPAAGSSVTVGHTQAYDIFNNAINVAANFQVVSGGATYMTQVDTPTTGGRYLFRATKSGYTTFTYQYAVGSIAYKTTLTLNMTNIYIAAANINQYQYNFSPNTPIVWELGPTVVDAYAYVIIPLNDSYTAFTTDTDQAFKSSFNPDNLTVTMTGHTEGDTWKYYIETASTAALGRVPGIIIKAKPSVLGTTATLNITYTT